MKTHQKLQPNTRNRQQLIALMHFRIRTMKRLPGLKIFQTHGFSAAREEKEGLKKKTG